MKATPIIITLVFLISCSSKPEITPTSSISDLKQEFQKLATISNKNEKNTKIESLWDSLVVNGLIPFTQDSTVLFLYNGDAESVSWNGDFNSWSNDKRFQNKGSNIIGTDIWLLEQTFPSNARLDYKVTLNGDNWILDPANPHQQMSGFGPNSELRMPGWKIEPLTKKNESIDTGSLSSQKIIESKNMGYPIQYRVYTPFGYEKFENLPVLYTTDGQEYASEMLGKTPIVLDNLIYGGHIEPVIVVFVEPVNPNDPSENKRQTELGNNENYLSFFVEELIPEIESNYKVNDTKEARVILGTSLGGLNSAYFAFSRPDVFGGAAIQAPAFWYQETIYDIVRNSNEAPSKIYMSVGTIGDNTPNARLMKQIFEQKELNFTYLEVNEGHSWGAWSAQIDDILVFFYGNRSE